ncbi:hypothetical protein ColTof4_10393 [Colletotrichum tofieldiae]|nr:hypothetical protein ColTof4_10393 [Colletotrichum tofieldiae]GKT84714.1 hypothetical protein Ct61P_02564 [Colletotrichum tofieldiae]
MIFGLEYVDTDVVFGEEQGEEQARGAGPDDHDLLVKSQYMQGGVSWQRHLIERSAHYNTLERDTVPA